MPTKKILAICVTFAALQLTACSSDKNSSSIPAHEEDPEHSGFIFVHAQNKSVSIGANISGIKVNEGPEMNVKFTYDFSIGRNEVTCGEFKEVIANNFEELSASITCKDDSQPISNVSYMDAILFANAKSKAEKMDTAYTYKKIVFDNDGHCTDLEALNFHPEVDAYRLPTEAEWIFVAKQGWSPKNSWNASNSDYESHQVCSKSPNKIDVCDMEGNMKEWVNDWLGRFRDTIVTNYLGAPDGGKIGERVIKGGSYRTDVDAINLFSRGDVYSITSSTRAEYVGFRLAIGSIPSPTWMNDNGNAINSKISVLANSATIQKITGTFRTKLAFRNDETDNLVFIDYASGTLFINEIQDSIPVYHPEISPNGEKVAFSTKYEGNSSKSELYVRDLNQEGTNLVKLDVESAAIPRWRIIDGDTVIIYVSNAGSNNNEEDFKSYSTWQVKFSNGKFGTPQKIFDGNYHGGISNDNSLAISSARILRAKISSHDSVIDTIWYNGEQACNASLSNDGTKRTAFLDFAGNTGKEFVGENYSIHGVILIADSTGKLIQSIKAPSKYTFDHTEWISEKLIIATLTNINGQHEKIVLIDTKNNNITELVSGSEIWHPNLWTKEISLSNESSLDLDSAGQYYVVGGSEAALSLRNKMEIFWKYRNSKLVVLGSSRSLNGVYVTLLEDSLTAINLSNVPNSIYVSEYLFNNYILKHLDNLKYIVVSLDIDMWWKQQDKSSDNFFYKEYKQFPGFVYDQNHNFWEDGYPSGLAEAAHEAFNFEVFENTFKDTRGFNREVGGDWEKDPKVDYDSTWFDKQEHVYYDNLRALESMIISAENRDITFIGVIFPMSPGFKKTGSFGRYGIRRSIAPSLIQEIKDLSKKHPNFILMDENKMGDHDYEFDEGSNKDHLNEKGAKRFTSRLDSLLRTLP